MLSEDYKKLKQERDGIKEDLIHFLGEPSRPVIERLLTLTRVLDRAAQEYAEHCDDPDPLDFDYQSDP